MKKMQLTYGVKLLISTFLGITTALFFLGYRYTDRQTDFTDAAALGAQTTSLFSKKNEHAIHCQPDAELKDCVLGVLARRPTHQVIWLGNSQLHAINHFQHGELNAPAILADALASIGVDLVTVSQPNANLQEQQLIFEYLRSKFPIQRVILPVVFDDFREDGLRDDVITLMQDSEFVQWLNKEDKVKRPIAKTDAGAKSDDASITPQSYVEGQINQFLDRNWPLWDARSQMRGDLLIGLYRLRNTIFGITPSTKRKVIPSHFDRNWQALEALVNSASRVGIEVVLYVAPIGGTPGERPYVEAEYHEFKEMLEAFAKRKSIDFVNFEDLVPPELWGIKGSTSGSAEAEPDFMHFTSAGHEVLAAALYKRIQNALRSSGGSAK